MARKMRRPRPEAPKVWHNPDLVPKRSEERAADRRRLEALFQPKADRQDLVVPPSSGAESLAKSYAGLLKSTDSTRTAKEGDVHKAARVVARAASPLDPKAAERERLIARLLAAEGRSAITRAANELFSSEHQIPDDQNLYLQVLEHSNEEKAAWAIERLSEILQGEPCKRPTVMDGRLRRLEEFADEGATKALAHRLRRQLQLQGRKTGEGMPALAQAPELRLARPTPKEHEEER